MKTITALELRAKLDRGDPFKLVMAMGGWEFEAAHIPGSLSCSSSDEAKRLLNPAEEIVVYCTTEDCPASKLLYWDLVRAGYERVCRYSAGVRGWKEAGFELEGDQPG